MANKWATWSRLLQLCGLDHGTSALCQEAAPLLEAARIRPAPKHWHVLSIRAPRVKKTVRCSMTVVSLWSHYRNAQAHWLTLTQTHSPEAHRPSDSKSMVCWRLGAGSQWNHVEPVLIGCGVFHVSAPHGEVTPQTATAGKRRQFCARQDELCHLHPPTTNSLDTIWVCLKIVYPYTQWLMILIPVKWLFHWEYTLFSDKPIWYNMTQHDSTSMWDPRVFRASTKLI